MKKVISGCFCIISGTLLQIAFLIVTWLSIRDVETYLKRNGKFWQAAMDYHLLPFLIVSCFLLALGLIFVIWGIFDKSTKN